MGQPEQRNVVNFTVKGQVVIPRRLRREFGIEKGTRAMVTATKDGILLKPITATSIGRLRGVLKNSQALEVLKRERRREREL